MEIYDLKVKDTKLNEIPLSDYRGKVLLIVNTASGCGFTPQYDGLETLYAKYRDQGFEVLDFPCNQFMGQAPGTNEELASFCQLRFGTQFKTFAKICATLSVLPGSVRRASPGSNSVSPACCGVSRTRK